MTLSGPNTDVAMASVGRLSEIEDLGGPSITDAGMLHLTGLRKLSSLFIPNTRVTEAGLEELNRELPRLTIIH